MHRHTQRLTAVALVVALLLAGCGSNPGSTPDPEAARATEPDAPQVVYTEPPPGFDPSVTGLVCMGAVAMFFDWEGDGFGPESLPALRNARAQYIRYGCDDMIGSDRAKIGKMDRTIEKIEALGASEWRAGAA